jgi:inhibitor of KinA
MPAPARFSRASDRTLLVSFGERIGREPHRRVRGLLASLQREPLASVLNLHPAYCSLLVRFDPLRASHQELQQEISERLARPGADPAATARQVEVPVCYGGEFGPDLEELAGLAGLTGQEVVRLHAQTTYTAYFLGFVPGFAYLGEVPEQIAAARLAAPRRRVESGSVGIAGRQTGIYPCAVPGGWRLIGRTPLSLFRPDRDPMSLLLPGDEVRFRPISPDEYADEYAGECAHEYARARQAAR